jgi:teichuronic acid biosynthesis glycosyltransferase TuaC
VELKVVAPVPYYPPVPFGWRRAYRGIRSRETRDGIDVHHPRYSMLPKVSSRFHGALLYRSTVSSVARLRRDYPFDVIDAHYMYPDAYAATRIGQALGVPVVSSARGSDINLIGRIPSLRPLVREAIARSRHVIAVSRALRDAMVALGAAPDRISVIPNGVDTAKFHPIPAQSARAELGLPPGQILVSVGNLVSNKGFDRLLRALQALQGSGERAASDLTLVVIGSGPEESRLKRLAIDLGLAPNVRFMGSISHDKLAPWYAAADCFCLATEREGWPNAVLESLACGTPVVATAVGGVPEIVRSESLGVLVGPTDADLSAGIRTALSRKWDRAEIARFGASHSWETAAASVFSTLEDAIRPGPREERVAS